MPSTPAISVPWSPVVCTTRSSFASRVSNFFGRRGEEVNPLPTARNTATYEVPLFLSPTRYEPAQRQQASDAEVHQMPSPFQLPMHAEGSYLSGQDGSWVRPTSSHYSNSEVTPDSSSQPNSGSQTRRHRRVAAEAVMVRKPKKSRTQGGQKRRPRRQKKVSLRRQMQTAKHLSLAFGLTFILAGVTYLVLATTGIASGTIFHVITLLLLLILLGVCLHSSIRWFLLSRRRRNRKHRPQHRQEQWFDGNQQGAEQRDIEAHGAESDDDGFNKPIQIIMKEDEIDTSTGVAELPPGVQRPPPVYGNFRTSKKINPNLVHWQQVPPSPLTPTYAEAMTDVQRVVGYRPPSYVASESGGTQIIFQQTRDVDAVMDHIHPLDHTYDMHANRI